MGENGDELLQQKKILRTESGSDDVHYPLFYEGLPDQYKLVAEQELNETPANKANGLRKLKEFMKRENLSCTDDLLITVLRSCKYNVKKSESKLKRFLKFRQTIIEKLCRLDEEKIDFILDDTSFCVLPYRDKYGRAVIVSKPTVRLDKYALEDAEPINMSLILYLLNFPMNVVCGISFISENKTDSFFLCYSIIKSSRAYINYVVDIPVRYGRADILNEMLINRIFFNAVVRRILPEKITNRVHFHGTSYKSLHSVYHPDIMPKELEGNMQPINDKHYRERLMNFIRALREEGQKRNPSVT